MIPYLLAFFSGSMLATIGWWIYIARCEVTNQYLIASVKAQAKREGMAEGWQLAIAAQSTTLSTK